MTGTNPEALRAQAKAAMRLHADLTRQTILAVRQFESETKKLAAHQKFLSNVAALLSDLADEMERSK